MIRGMYWYRHTHGCRIVYLHKVGRAYVTCVTMGKPIRVERFKVAETKYMTPVASAQGGQDVCTESWLAAGTRLGITKAAKRILREIDYEQVVR